MLRPLTIALCLFATGAGWSLTAAEVTPAGGEPSGPTEEQPDAKPFLGVEASDTDAATAGGLRILHVVTASTAQQMGLRKGDILAAIGDQPIRTRAELKQALFRIGVGKDFAVTVVRDGAKQQLSGTMQAAPTRTDIQKAVEETRQKMADTTRAIGEAKKRQANLAQSMQELAEALEKLPGRLDKVAKEFKTIYPDGTFTVQVHIDIRTGEEPAVDLSPEPKDPAEVQAEDAAEEAAEKTANGEDIELEPATKPALDQPAKDEKKEAATP